MPTFSLDLVTVGWEHPGWAQAFYPEDLPLDWRLTYFANEFSAVAVPGARWVEADASSFRHWCEDVADGFRFYLADPGSKDARGGLELAQQALGDKLAGLVLGEGIGRQAAGDVTCFQLLTEPGGVPTAHCLPAWRIPPVLIRDLRAGRFWLQSLGARMPGDRGLLVLDGGDIDIEDLRCWWNLVWLMGLSVA